MFDVGNRSAGLDELAELIDALSPVVNALQNLSIRTGNEFWSNQQDKRMGYDVATR